MSDPHPTMLANRLRRNERRLRNWVRRNHISCYRVYDRDIPEIPLVIDRYDDALHIATVLRPDEEERAENTPWLTELLDAAADTLAVPHELLFLKHRRRQRGNDQYTRFGTSGATRIVREAGLRFEVNLSDYLDTGLFLDHRPLRQRIRGDAHGKDVLNLFAYTGAFTIHAAAGAARSTTSVDLSNTYLDWCARNLELNRQHLPLPPDAPADTPPGDLSHHRLVRADILRWLDQTHDDRWDIIVCDPPSFSNSKAMDDTLDVRRDHPELITGAMRLLRPGGTLWFSCNRKGFRLDTSIGAAYATEDITPWSVDPDFERGKPHRAWRITAPDAAPDAATDAAEPTPTDEPPAAENP